jgi:hypothetical protein
MRSTSEIDSTFGRPRPRFGPDRSPRHARGFEAAPVEIGQIVPQRLGFGAGEIVAGAGEELGKIHEIPAVGVKRIAARALFGGKHVKEQADQPGI